MVRELSFVSRRVTTAARPPSRLWAVVPRRTLIIRPKQSDGKPIVRPRHSDGPRATTDRAVLNVLIRSRAGLLCNQFDDLAAIWANERAALGCVIVHHLNSEP